jgi:CheY-like chemotaxis protein
MRIAYVEDNPTNLQLVKRVASMNSHEVTNYQEGEVALQALSHEKFDLILMDVELAGEMNGLQVTRALRARGLTTPIIAVTAYAMMGDREKCLEAGCNDYLPKPIPIAELLVMLARYDALIQERERAAEVPAGTREASPTPVTAPPSPPAAPAIPQVSIVQPHHDPIQSNAASLPIETPPEPLPPPPPAVNPAAGSPSLPAHQTNPGMKAPTGPTKSTTGTGSLSKPGETNVAAAAKPVESTVKPAEPTPAPPAKPVDPVKPVEPAKPGLK